MRCGRIFSFPVSFFLRLLFARFILVPPVQAANRIRRSFRPLRVLTSSFYGCMISSLSCPHLRSHPSCLLVLPLESLCCWRFHLLPAKARKAGSVGQLLCS